MAESERKKGKEEGPAQSKWQRLKVHWRRAAELTDAPKEKDGGGEKAAPLPELLPMYEAVDETPQSALEVSLKPEPPPIAESALPTPELDEKQIGDREKKIPSGSEKRQRMKGVRARVTEAEYAGIEKRASAAGLSTAAYLRACALGHKGPRAVRRPPIELETLSRAIAELNKIGSNINQIARALNSGHDVTPPEIQKATEELSLTVGVILKAAGKR